MVISLDDDNSHSPHNTAASPPDKALMPQLPWKDSPVRGHPEIDGQRWMLLEATNGLHDRIMGEQKRQDLMDAIQGLEGYADYRFSDEERLMLRHGYPELEAHLKFRECMDAGSATVHHSDSPTTAAEILFFLTRWPTRHIQRDDRTFIAFVNHR